MSDLFNDKIAQDVEITNAVERINTRSPEMLENNCQNTLATLEHFHRDEQQREKISLRRQIINRITRANSLEQRSTAFSEYFDNNVFNSIIHTTTTDLGESIELKSPEQLGNAAHSGDTDKEMGNTNYVFATANALRSKNSYLPFEYEIDSRDCHVVPLDQSFQGNYPGGKTAMLEVYAKNIYTFDQFRKVFSTYCATIFESPAEAIDFFNRKWYYISRADAWEDESFIRNSDSESEAKVFKKMQNLYHNHGIVPPFSPEFQYKDSVKGKRIEKDSE